MRKAYFGYILGDKDNKSIILLDSKGTTYKHHIIVYSISSKSWYFATSNTLPEKSDFIPSQEELKTSIKLLFEEGIGI